MSLSIKAVWRASLQAEKISKAVDKAEARVLFQQGGLLRKAAKQRLRRRKRSSTPGESPSVHASGRYSLKNILFRVDKDSHSVVVGMVKHDLPSRAVTPTGNQTVPQILEFGGTVELNEQRPRNTKETFRWRLANPNRSPPVDWLIRRRQTHVSARPTMEPALQSIAPKLAAFYRNSVK